MAQQRAIRICSIEAKVEVAFCDVLRKMLDLETPNLDVESSDQKIFKFHRSYLMGKIVQ